ncbi:hypothetical protein MWN34_10720 [Ancylobacter sp. 6x-1]|uniref:DUF6876 domain-containing protein n=1 Tax=Ancylobacter crimeensis TaxID=2579147 RepID=A0ABT0DBP1_9HYPH|nr:DUF6876 family protein [Ancylobacter crimeensis]MCK0197385.1 hypothetical protein [Ancylobacter crimeensis]
MPIIAKEPFQVWALTVASDQTGELACEDGNGRPVYTKRLTFTDFPAEGIHFFLTDAVLLLPSEY